MMHASSAAGRLCCVQHAVGACYAAITCAGHAARAREAAKQLPQAAADLQPLCTSPQLLVSCPSAPAARGRRAPPARQTVLGHPTAAPPALSTPAVQCHTSNGQRDLLPPCNACCALCQDSGTPAGACCQAIRQTAGIRQLRPRRCRPLRQGARCKHVLRTSGSRCLSHPQCQTPVPRNRLLVPAGCCPSTGLTLSVTGLS